MGHSRPSHYARSTALDMNGGLTAGVEDCLGMKEVAVSVTTTGKHIPVSAFVRVHMYG